MNKSVQIQDENSEMNITDEIKFQEEIREDKFFIGEFITTKILECEAVDKGKIEYNGVTYEDIDIGDNMPIGIGQKAYLPIFIYKHRNKYKFVTSGIYSSEENAQEEIKKYNNIPNQFELKFDSYNKIKYVTNKNQIIGDLTYSKIYNNLKNVTISIAFLQMSLALIGMILFFIAGIYISFFIYVAIALFITFLTEMLFNSLNTVFQSGEIIDLNIDDIDLSNKTQSETVKESETKHEYKIVKADVKLTESGLILDSKELDCKWIYERGKNGKIEDDGLYILKNIPIQDNYCILSVKPTHKQNSFVSENNTWEIDIESTFD